MRFLLSFLAVLAALLLISVSASMNYLFMAGMSKGVTEGQVLGGASVAVDIFKALLPVFMWWAWKDRRYPFLIPASAMFMLFAAFSFTSAVGFAASNRGHVSDIKEGANAELKSIRSDLAAEKSKLAGIPKHRPAGTVEQAIKAQRQNRRWKSTNGCADGGATASASRTFCKNYFTLTGELETAIAAGRIEQRIKQLRLAETRLTDRGAGGDADPQVSILAKLSGNDQSTVRMALILFMAGLLEIGSGLGLWIATGHSEIFRRKEQQTSVPQTDMQQPVEQPVAQPAAATPRTTIEHPPARASNDLQPSVAEIQDYLLERIRPAATGGLTLAQLYADYTTWAQAKTLPVATQGFFGQVIETAMDEVGIHNDGRHYVGIQLAPTMPATPALTSTG